MCSSAHPGYNIMSLVTSTYGDVNKSVLRFGENR